MEEMSQRFPKFTRKFNLLLDQRGVSHTRLAEELSATGDPNRSVSASAVSRYASGSVPPPDVALRIARFFKVDYEWLVDEGRPLLEEVEGGGQDIPFPYAIALSKLPLLYLTREVRRRVVFIQQQISILQEKLDAIDWQQSVQAIRVAKSVEGAPAFAAAAIEIAEAFLNIRSMFSIPFHNVLGDESTDKIVIKGPTKEEWEDLNRRAWSPLKNFLEDSIAAEALQRWQLKLAGSRPYPQGVEAAIEDTRKFIDKYRELGGPFLKP